MVGKSFSFFKNFHQYTLVLKLYVSFRKRYASFLSTYAPNGINGILALLFFQKQPIYPKYPL